MTAALASTKERSLEQVKDMLCAAAQILRGVGPEYDRIGWMVEDVITYIEEAESAKEFELSAENFEKSEVSLPAGEKVGRLQSAKL